MQLANIRNRDGLCAVSECPRRASHLRITDSGFTVFYCIEHRIDAELHFGEKAMHDKRLATR